MKAKAKIQLDVFSGRPNPSWTLDEAAAQALLAKLNAARKTTPLRMPEGVGFRGFLLSVSDGTRDREFHVYGSRIREGHQSYVDADRGVEVFVVSTMPSELKNEFADILPK